MKKASLFLVLLIISIIIISCRKEKIQSQNAGNSEPNDDNLNAYNSSNVTGCFNSNLVQTTFSQLNVTDGASDLNLINGSLYQMGIYTKESRAEIENHNVSSYGSKIRFRYLGHSNEITETDYRQIGLKVRANNTCNVLYVMWSIEKIGDSTYPEHIFVKYKSNPGDVNYSDCLDSNGHESGYQTLNAADIPPPLSSVKDGLYHTLEALLIPLGTNDGSVGNDFILHVCADGYDIWHGNLFNIPEDILGPSGFRTDNGKFEFYFYTDIDKSSKAWNISYSANSFWRQARISGVNLADIKFGDFNGDGKTDAFRTSNGKWYVSLGATSEWIEWHTSNLALQNLELGDFNGDGITDIFYTSSGHWYVSLNGNSPWQQWYTSSTTLHNMRFGDFNGDGKTDAFKTSGSHWFVSLGANSPWQQWNTSTYTINDLHFGKFNQDSKSGW